MLFSVDESGDLGIKKDSSDHFVLVLVVFQNIKDAQQVAAIVERFKQSHLPGAPEIKFNDLEHSLCIKFLQTIANSPFRIKAMIIKKTKLRKLEKQHDYIKELIKKHATHFQDARPVIDGELPKEQRQKRRSQLLQINKEYAPKKIIKRPDFVDSKKDYLIQLADMIAGSLLYSTHENKPNRYVYKKLIDKKIDDIDYKTV